MRDLYKMSPRGNLPSSSKTDRTFQVKTENQLTAIKRQHMGVLQGNVLSATLFIIKIYRIG